MNMKLILFGIALTSALFMSIASPAFAGTLQSAWILSQTTNWKKGKSMTYSAYVWAQYHVTTDSGSFTLKCSIQDQVGNSLIWTTLGVVTGSASTNQNNVNIQFITSRMTATTLNGGGTYRVLGQCNLSGPSGTITFNTDTETISV
jgi:hypothetical protein